MKKEDIKKPNDEIRFWKSKGAKLNKAHKLTQDDRVKLLVDTLQMQKDNNMSPDNSVLDN
jgi:hypothetical protein